MYSLRLLTSFRITYWHVRKIRPLPKNPVKQLYTKFKAREMFLYSCENFVAHPFLLGLWVVLLRKFLKKKGFRSCLVYVLTLFCLN